MQRRTLRSLPSHLCEAGPVRLQFAGGRPSGGFAAEIFKTSRHARGSGRGYAFMGDSTASVAMPRQSSEVDFALIGHQESWRAAADVLAVLRGPERTPLPDDEIKDVLPWISPRAI